MRHAINTGLDFGLTSGVITTLGLVVGLHAGTNSLLAVVGGIITIAIADSMSDALGIHISKEGDPNSNEMEVWVATLVTFASKMVMSLSFLVPILVFELQMAIYVSVAWGLLVLAALSYYLAVRNDDNAAYVIGEHLLIAIVVIVAAQYVGGLVAFYFTST